MTFRSRAYMESEHLLYHLPRTVSPKMTLTYYEENAEFLKKFSPRRIKGFYSMDHQKRLLKNQRRAAKNGSAFAFWLTSKKSPDTLIGFVSLNGIIYGSFRSCYLSYSLSAALKGHGLMTEAVIQATAFAFDGLRLHRVEINIVPENCASIRVAQKAGYAHEGVSPSYLAIDGEWKDHIHMVRLNSQIAATDV